MRALDEPLPREVWDRPKQGFTLPFQSWLVDHREELAERALAPGIFESRAVQGLWDRLSCGRAHWSRPWALVAYSTWLERLEAIDAASRRDLPAQAIRPGSLADGGGMTSVVLGLGWYFPESLGGTETYVRALTRRLRHKGYHVAIAAPDSNNHERGAPQRVDAIYEQLAALCDQPAETAAGADPGRRRGFFRPRSRWTFGGRFRSGHA